MSTSKRVSRGQVSPTLAQRALLSATSLVAEGLSEERLLPRLARCAVDAVEADFAALYLQPDAAGTDDRHWRMVASWGGDPEILAALPGAYGTGGGILTPAFEATREICVGDLLDGAPDDSALPVQLPARSIVGLPVRRRDHRPIGVLLVGARTQEVFSEEVLKLVRAVGQLVGLGIDNARLAAGQQREQRKAVQSAVTLGTILESVGSGVCVVELDGTVRVVNKTLQDLFGLPSRPVGIAQVTLFASATVKPREEAAFQQRLVELSADPSEVDESEWELATEPLRIVQRYSAPMRSQVGEVVGRVEVYTDITESRRLYTQLLNSEKLRAIGEMASGVAHDFNNLLASIVGQTELLHPDDLPPTTRQAIATIRQAALDGARIVRSLQGLARPRVETPSTAADLNETVQLAADMARPRWAGAALDGSGRIDLKLNLAEPTTLARAAIDPAELREVLLNLLFNAADAMPDGGRIEITTRPGQIPGTGDVEVRDTGHGMPESVRARIFEPFFSTKGPKGSGLGLAVAYSIITRRGGKIDVESRPGQGTAFTLRLPNAPMPPVTMAAIQPGAGQQSAPGATLQPSILRAPAAAKLHGARILVADDEPGLVAIVRQLMERSGATVSTANGGQAAVAALRSPDTTFDVVITDLDMPEVDGWAVAAAAKQHKPDTRVVMLTGWAGEIVPEDFKTRGVDVVLAKPCSRADLESCIANLLTPRPSTGFDVLLVDDEPAFARAVRDLLGLQGHQVTVVDSADKALEAMAAHSYEVVVTDYSLGSITGAQLAEQVLDQHAGVYVVLVTGYATEIDDPTLMSRGVDAVLPKPCRGDDLRKVLGRVSASATTSRS